MAVQGARLQRNELRAKKAVVEQRQASFKGIDAESLADWKHVRLND